MFGGFYDTPGFNYSEAFAWEFCLTTLTWGVCFLVGSYLVYNLSIYIKTRAKRKYTALSSEKLIDDGIDLDASLQDFNNYIQMEKDRMHDTGYKFHQFLYVISSLMSWFALFCITMAPSVLSSLGVISIIASIAITLVIGIFKYFGLVYSYCPSCIKSDKDRIHTSVGQKIARFFKRAFITTRLYKWRFTAFIVFGLAYSVAMPLITAGSCMNFFNEGYGYNYQGFGVSTTFTRYLELNTVCPQGTICHLYATLPENGATQVILNVHTGTDISSITIGYETLEKYNAAPQEPLGKNATSKSFLTDLEQRGDRYVHSVYLSGLSANTTYFFEVYANGQVLKNGTYLTLPSKDMERNIVMIAGGDVGTTQMAKQMTQMVSGFSPDIILVGGDLAYDNGIPSCYYSHDLFLNMFENLNTQVGRVVPLMFSIGNHDVGMNAFQNGPYDIKTNLYNMFYPQHSAVNDQGKLTNEVPDLEDRVTYSYHTFGNTLQFSLDSAYITNYAGKQLDFLNATSAAFPDLVKLANYHVPVYPVCYSAAYDDIRTLEEPQQYWSPLFQAYKFASIFENHVHLYKKTYPILDGAPNPGGEGVIYFGDGNWGVAPNSCWPTGADRNQTGIFERFGSNHHVWMLNITAQNLTYAPVDVNGNFFDTPFVLNVTNYISI